MAASLKFVVDMNVGKLATWVRALGYDTLFENPVEDDRLVELARDEKRVLLTKDTGIMQRRPVVRGEVQALLIEGTEWRSQLRQVVRKFKLKRDKEFTRCLGCNEILVQCDPADAAPRVPTNVSSTQEEFVRCRNCGKIFWKGAHWRRMALILDAVTSG
jgi:hypothetical protein